MKRIYAYVAALALTFGLTAGIYAGTGVASGQSDVQTEITDDNDPPTGGGGEIPTGGDDENPDPQAQQHTIVGDGTIGNPYTVEDVRAINLEAPEDYKTVAVWVKALIYGYFKGEPFNEDNIVKGANMPEGFPYYNIVLVDDVNKESPTVEQLVPVKLGIGGEDAQKVKAALNLTDNPEMVGQQVYLYCNIETYGGVNSLTFVDKYSFDGENILPIEEPPTPPTPTSYNIWVGNTQVTSSNADNITSPVLTRGTVNFDTSTKTLTLNNVKFTFNQAENTGFAIRSEEEGLTIKTVGTNESFAMNFYFTGSTTIEGGNWATLDFYSGRTIHAHNTSLIIKDAIISIASGGAGLDCANSTLKIINSGITITACNPVIKCKSVPVFEDCRIISIDPSKDLYFDNNDGEYYARYEGSDFEKLRSMSISNAAPPIVRESCGLTLDKTQTTFNIGDSDLPFDAPKGQCVPDYDGVISYSSSDPSIISVNQYTGELTFNSVGTVTITIRASTTDKYNGAYKTYTITYGVLEDPELKFSRDVYEVAVASWAYQYGLEPTKRTTADYTLTSDNPDVVSIDNGKQIHFGAVGTANLTATVPATNRYRAGTATCTVHVVNSIFSNVIVTPASQTVEYKKEGDFSRPSVQFANGYTGRITYTSNNSDIVDVNPNTGEVIKWGPNYGTATIGVHAAADGPYLKSDAYYTIEYVKGKPIFTFNPPSKEVYLSVGKDDGQQPYCNVEEEHEIEFTSNRPAVVEVDKSNGKLTLHKTGEATITAIFKETKNYRSAEASYVVTVVSDGTEITILDVINPGLHFQSTGGKLPFKIRTDRNWSISTGRPWFTVSESSGSETFEHGTIPKDSDYKIIYVTCETNTGENARDGEISIVAGDKKTKLAVSQDGTVEIDPIIDNKDEPNLSVSPSNMNLVVTRSNTTLPMLVIKYSGDDTSEISFESSNESVIKVEADGSIHVVGQGEAVLKVKASETDFYKPAEATVTINASFPDPDLVEDIEPISGNITVDFSALAGKDMSTGNVLDNIYYSFNTDLSVGDGYSEADECIVLNSTMTADEMQTVVSQTLAQLDEDGKFHGIVMKVPAGTGTISVNCEAGGHYLTAQIGSEAPTQHAVLPRSTVDIPYNVSDPTLVYIYATSERMSSSSSLRSVRRVPKKTATSVLLYGITVKTVSDSVEGVKADTLDNETTLYTVGGQTISRKNAHDGIYVGADGSKRAVK